MSFFSDLADAISGMFGGGGGRGGGGGGDSLAPSRSPRPEPRPSILSRSTPEGTEYVATQDMPQFGITAGQRSMEPEYGALSLSGLTSSDPGNVMRNIQGAERAARADTGMGGDGEAAPPPEVAKAERPAAPAAPAAPAEVAKAERPVAEGRGESAMARARRLGLASTIATSPGGLLAGGEGTTRQRRSLMGGGLIR